MTPILCARGCTVRGRHVADPCDESCTGCLPARVADGLAVCTRCERIVRDGLRDVASLYADLGDPRRSAIPGQRRGGGGPPLLISDAARAARSAIRAALVSWCLVLEEDYRLTLPADTVRAMAHHVAVQAGRLLDSEHADQLVHDIEGAVSVAWRLARPGRPRLRIQCDCGEWVAVATGEDEVMTCRGCDAWGVLSWWVEREPGRALAGAVTLREAADILLMHHGHDVPLATLRTWTRWRDEDHPPPLRPIPWVAQRAGDEALRYDMAAIVTQADAMRARRRRVRVA